MNGERMVGGRALLFLEEGVENGHRWLDKKKWIKNGLGFRENI